MTHDPSQPSNPDQPVNPTPVPQHPASAYDSSYAGHQVNPGPEPQPPAAPYGAEQSSYGTTTPTYHTANSDPNQTGTYTHGSYPPGTYVSPDSPTTPGYPSDPYASPSNPYDSNYQTPPAPPVYPPQQGYYAQPPYGEPPKKAKVWPWVLIGCLVLGMLGIGGCVGCVALTGYIASNSEHNQYALDDYERYLYDNGDSFDLDEYLSDDYSTGSSGYTIADIEKRVEDEPSTVDNGIATTGCFEVGSDADLAPGLYYVEGSQTDEGIFAVLEPSTSDPDYYTPLCEVSYFGNYYVELDDGQIIAFLGPAGSHLVPAQESHAPQTETIESGCYRVGADIAPGTYQVTYNAQSDEATQESAVYIMKDLAWDTDSITESHYLIAGGSHIITIEEGQYVELYEASMVSTESAA